MTCRYVLQLQVIIELYDNECCHKVEHLLFESTHRHGLSFAKIYESQNQNSCLVQFMVRIKQFIRNKLKSVLWLVA